MRPTPREDDKHYPMKYIDTTKLTGDTWDNFSRTLIDEFQAWKFDDTIEELAVLHAPNNDDQTAGREPVHDYLIIRDRIDTLWDNILAAIHVSMNISLPMKKRSSQRNYHKCDADLDTENKIRRHTAKVRALISHVSNLSCGKRIKYLALNKESWRRKIAQYNNDYKAKIYHSHITDNSHILSEENIFSTDWIVKARSAVKHRSRIDASHSRLREAERINARIEQKFDTFQANQTKIINNSLDRHKSKITIDRIATTNIEGESHLETNPDNINRLAEEHYGETTRARNTSYDRLDDFWTNIYQPKQHWTQHFADMNEPITLDEWLTILREVNSSSAAGPSGISYNLIKKFPEEIHLVIINFVSLSLKLGIVPKQWRSSTICPIPKPDAFNYNLNNTRPIALLDNIRKCATKLVTARLGQILTRHQILKSPNFCGLKGEDTSIPLKIFNDIIEDAKANKKPLYAATQDLKKAYDSLPLAGLRMALLRIDIPTNIVNWIIDLFKHRSMRIITEFGLTNRITAGDGIDQGDAISPLLWRIFYDPLLVALAQDESNGYTLQVDWPQDLNCMTTQSRSITILVMAYMDDTVFTNSSLTALQRSIDLAATFYTINDIFINGKKTGFLVINDDSPKDQISITIGTDRVLVSPTEHEIRYLGCYFGPRRTTLYLKKRLSSAINDFVSATRSKILSVGHIVYLVNRVLIPKLLYVGQLATLSENEWNSLFTPVLKLVKQKLGLASSFPTSALFHPDIVGLDYPWKILCANQVAMLAKYINGNSLASEITLIRLLSVQLRAGIPTNILTYNLDVLLLLKPIVRATLSLHTLIIGRQLNISLCQDPYDEQDWTLPYNGTPLIELFAEIRKVHHFLTFRQLARFPIFWLEQILLPSGRLISWNLYRLLAGQSPKGRVAKWYSTLTKVI
ncbi:RNA-directed DNA polymerase from mobile element jockey-like [Rhizophagus clarus]|uniref:RNA-directed DNA polymerase from mobile element jockey-like n=1 Tax=Rhizophagus clarus TaxID=94130 RepID=A0A8H3R0Q3_9GLOM|nr:RNA-directed DNA polymerase from mobile element jockey-like [Rhizophagus clarus]